MSDSSLPGESPLGWGRNALSGFMKPIRTETVGETTWQVWPIVGTVNRVSLDVTMTSTSDGERVTLCLGEWRKLTAMALLDQMTQGDKR